MAFPTSGLSNNQVHKEGNRAFVYDSALGVWDQVKETSRTENKIFSGEIGADVTFPAGHLINITHITKHWSGNAYTSGTIIPVETIFTPLAATNNILIKYCLNYQFYGNNSVTGAGAIFRFYHNAAKTFISDVGSPDYIGLYDNNNYSQAFHRTWQYTHEAYLPVTSNSANRGQGRRIHCTVTPNAGRWYIASELGDNFIQIMEFA